LGEKWKLFSKRKVSGRSWSANFFLHPPNSAPGLRLWFRAANVM